MCQDYSRVYLNHTLRVKLPVPVVITLVSVIFTRIRVKINLVCVNTTLCVGVVLVHVLITFVPFEITLRV
jgi:hypothetical protein